MERQVYRWTRLVTIFMLVGGGSIGLFGIAAGAVQSNEPSDVYWLILVLGTLLFLFFLSAGLFLADNPAKKVPALVALAFQIPVFGSPVFGYRIYSGLSVTIGVIGGRFDLHWSFGGKFLVWFAEEQPLSFAINLIALFAFLLLWRMPWTSEEFEAWSARVKGPSTTEPDSNQFPTG
ncbi:MAG: hypothetical protein JSS66_02435 [Armatimonadetes bacterium]|nr:hypothetical protein [Armatimonadota bacterium]